MRTITHPRIIAATGFLGIATLLGASAAAATPAMQHQGTSAMQGESQPGMQQEAVLTGMTNDAQPGMQHEARPATIPSE